MMKDAERDLNISEEKEKEKRALSKKLENWLECEECRLDSDMQKSE